MSTIRPTFQAEVDSLSPKMDKLAVSLEFSDSDSSTDHELDDRDSESDYDLDDLTIKEIFALMPTFSPVRGSMHTSRYFDLLLPFHRVKGASLLSFEDHDRTSLLAGK